MAHIQDDMIGESSATSGTGDITPTGALAGGSRTFASAMATNDTADVFIRHATLDEWEHVRVTMLAGGDLQRATPYSSSNAGAAVSFSAGGLKVFIPSGKRVLALDDQEALTLPVRTTDAAAAPTNKARLYQLRIGGRTFPAFVDQGGGHYEIQPHVGFRRTRTWQPSSGTAVTVLGMPLTSVGTVSHNTLASTNLLTQTHRWRMTSAGTANSANENRAAQLIVWRGNAAGFGGFTFIARVALTVLSTNNRAFFGLTAATGAIATTQVPSALTSCIGFGYDATETTLRFMTNDASGACTRVDLGANFPTNSTTTLLTLMLHCEPNASEIAYRVVNESTGNLVEGTANTDLPPNTTFLCPHLYQNNGGDASAVAFECAGLTIESDW